MSSTRLNRVSSPLAPTEPDKIQNLHCRPQNSTAIACSWIPPDSDFDGYSIECRKMDTQEIEFSRKLEKEKSVLNIMMLVPHKRYLVSIKVQSAGVTSEVVEDSTITMIDRKCSFPKVCMGPLSPRVEGFESLSAISTNPIRLHTVHVCTSLSCYYFGDEDRTAPGKWGRSPGLALTNTSMLKCLNESGFKCLILPDLVSL